LLDGLHQDGRPVVVEVGTITPYLRPGAAAATAGGAAAIVEERKRADYAALPDRYAFVPVGYDMLGAPGPSAKALLKRLSARVADRHGQSRSVMLLYHRVEMQALVQRNIARLLLVNIEGDGTGRGLVSRIQELYHDGFHTSPDDGSDDGSDGDVTVPSSDGE
jgi:hypothetical protein